MTLPELKIALELNLRPASVAATIQLLDAGNTLPFIARYRKEATGSLDEMQIASISAMLKQIRAVDERRKVILASLEEQDKLSSKLHKRLLDAQTLTELEDIYYPFKPKRRTRADIARDKGLEPLAKLILNQLVLPQPLADFAAPYLNDDVKTVEEAFAGARDIVAEKISEDAKVRGPVRERALRYATLRVTKLPDADDPKWVYEIYYDFDMRIDRVKPYQIMAINRGEAEKILRVAIQIPERDWRQPIREAYYVDNRSPLAGQLEMAGVDSAKRLLLPAIERDVHRILTEQAESHSIGVFATNLRGLLSQPPLTGQVILGIDPGYRSGCKVAVIDETGKVFATETIYPHEPQLETDEALETLETLIVRYHVTLIAIGNGTASRDTEQIVAQLTRNMKFLHYLIVNEAGASVYSASPLAREELPDMDVTLRGAVSIARRAQDPLAELVKIDPKSIGVGLYQHDVDQKKLGEALDSVVASVVNQVGVDLNTASVALLNYVAGIGAKLAANIVAYREKNGAFRDRQSLRKVTGLGPKAFEQAAGFLRVRDGDNPLDATAIHPESYRIAEAILQQARVEPDEPVAIREAELTELIMDRSLEFLAAELDVGLPTLKDIFDQLMRPGRDPREDLPPPILRSDVLSVDDLKIGMQLNGTVRNIVDFGAFVDIGVKQEALLHRSRIPGGTRLNIGDVVEVEIKSFERDRGRISVALV